MRTILVMALTCTVSLTVVFTPSFAGSDPVPLVELDNIQLKSRIHGDLQNIELYRSGLRSTVAYAASHPDLFPPGKLSKARLLPRKKKEAIWNTWKSHLDYILALDSIGNYYGAFYRLKNRELKNDAFLAAYSAFLAQYRYALDFISLVENDPGLDILLNDKIPEIGLPSGSYDRYKFRFLNVVRGAEFAAMTAVYKTLEDNSFTVLPSSIEEDSRTIWEAGRGHGEILTAINALDMIRKAGFTAWFPVQAGISEWMGDTKVRRVGQSLITDQQIEALESLLQPGDILLERREWYLTNVGLPGFWPHAALYIGSPQERQVFFNDPLVQSWVREQGQKDGAFEALLVHRYPGAYAQSLHPLEGGHAPRVLEAIAEGVSFTTLEHSAAADSLAVLRPRLTKSEKAKAILRAFLYSGRPYDFNFDFLTDSALVCTELVYKSYAPTEKYTGIRFPLIEIMGRPVMPANEMARQFDAEFGSGNQQMDLILFLDGHEKTKSAHEASLDNFRQSWKRPKWHIFLQEERIDSP